jgi:DNA repair protein RadC
VTDKPHYAGHRQRLRERFLKAGADGLPDYELLELLLFMAQTRGDVKPLAKALLHRFGSFAEVIAAEPETLRQVKGLGDAGIAALKAIHVGAERLLRARLADRPVLGNWQALLDYCRAGMAFAEREHFRVLFLNNRNVLIADEVQQRGTVDHTPAYPREVVKRALELGATALIMVHNHPSGDSTPSKADIEMTREVQAAGAKLGIAVHDHVVIAKTGNSSFKSLGLL